MRASGLILLPALAGLAHGGWSLGQTLLVPRAAPPAPVEIAAELEEAARALPSLPAEAWPPLANARAVLQAR